MLAEIIVYLKLDLVRFKRGEGVKRFPDILIFQILLSKIFTKYTNLILPKNFRLSSKFSKSIGKLSQKGVLRRKLT